VNQLISLLAELNQPTPAGRRAVIRLLEAGPQAVAPLIAALDSPDQLTQSRAARLLGLLGDPRAVAPLGRIMLDPQCPIPAGAAQALRYLKAGDILLEALNSPLADSRAAAAQELSFMEEPRCIEPLIALLDDPEKTVQLAALQALARLDDPRALPALQRYLGLQEASVWKIYFNTTSTIAPALLLQALNHPLIEIRSTAVQKLYSIYVYHPQSHPSINSLLKKIDPQGNGKELLASLIAPLLQDPTCTINMEVATLLRFFPTQTVVPALTRALQDKSTWTHCEIARTLGQIGGPAALETLITMLQDSDRQVRIEVLKALGTIGNRQAQIALRQAINDPEPGISQCAIEILKKLHAPPQPLTDENRTLLLSKIKNSHATDMEIAQIAEILRYLYDSQTIELLIQIGADPNPRIRWNASVALQRIATPRAIEFLIQQLQDEHPGIRYHVALALANLGHSEGYPILQKALEETHSSAQNTAQATKKISRGQAFASLYQALQDENNRNRFMTVQALGRDGNPLAVEPLIKLLTRTPPKRGDVRLDTFAARALGQIGDPRAIPPLLEALREAICEHDTLAMGATIQALDQLEAREALPLLLLELENPDGYPVKNHILHALIKIKNPQAIDALTATLKDPLDLHRQIAVAALAQIEDIRILEPLQKMVRKGDLTCQRFALLGLSRLGDPRTLELFMEILQTGPYTLRKPAMQGLVRIGSPALPALIELLEQSPHSSLRGRAAWILGRIGDPAAVPALLQALKDDHPRLRCRAVHALSRIATPEARKAVQQALNDPAPTVRAAATASAFNT